MLWNLKWKQNHSSLICVAVEVLDYFISEATAVYIKNTWKDSKHDPVQELSYTMNENPKITNKFKNFEKYSYMQWTFQFIQSSQGRQEDFLHCTNSFSRCS